MRNIQNAIKKVAMFKGPLTESLVVRTAKQTLNQYGRGWIEPESQEAIEAVNAVGLTTFLEGPLLDRKLDAALTVKGLNFLNTLLFTKSGKRRDTVHTRDLGDHVFEIVKDFKHFTFAGFEYAGGGNELVPRWRVHSKSGDSFSYCCTMGPYNSGGYFEVWGR